MALHKGIVARCSTKRSPAGVKLRPWTFWSECKRTWPGCPMGCGRMSSRLRRQAVALARSHGLDVERADLAAASHDVCRIVKAGDLLDMAQSFGLPVMPIDEAFPVFLHGPVGAEVLKRDFGPRRRGRR